MTSLPLLIRASRSSRCCGNNDNLNKYKYGMLVLTFFCYMSYHMSRKPFSIVKGQLHRNCTGLNGYTMWYHNHIFNISFPAGNTSSNGTWCDFAPFDKNNYNTLFGDLDYAFLIAYAVGMYFSGMIAERLPLRYFLSAGMVLSGIFTSMFGLGYYQQIHVLKFYIFAQILNGLAQTTGWPAVVACMGNWFGKEKRGLIMGIWNSHTSFGNIFGSLIASAFVGSAWGLSFIIPGAIIGCLGILTFFTLIERPEDLGGTYESVLDSDEDECSEECGINANHQANTLPCYDSIPQETPPPSYASVPHSSDYDGFRSKPDVRAHENKAIGFLGALFIPGVVEFSLCLLFAKLVSYTFLFWLPFYIQTNSSLSTQMSGVMSTLFDVGGIFGGIAAGIASDRAGGRATTCGVMLLIGAGMMYLFHTYGTTSMAVNIVLLLLTGAFVNGPYALITTAVSADLGTHPVLKGNAKALSTVTAIIDGTGSIGAALGPFFTGLISPTGWQNVFWMLIGANCAAMLLLTRLMVKEILEWCTRCHEPSTHDTASSIVIVVKNAEEQGLVDT